MTAAEIIEQIQVEFDLTFDQIGGLIKRCDKRVRDYAKGVEPPTKVQKRLESIYTDLKIEDRRKSSRVAPFLQKKEPHEMRLEKIG